MITTPTISLYSQSMFAWLEDFFSVHFLEVTDASTPSFQMQLETPENM